MSLPEQLEYTHNPNNLISFINYQCSLYGEPVRITNKHQKFIDDVYFSDKSVIEIPLSRQDGNSTLFLMIAMFYMLNGKNILYYTQNATRSKHCMDNTMQPIDVFPYKKFITYRYGLAEVILTLEGKRASGIMKIANNSQRGYSFDVVIVDGIRSIEQDRTLQELYPVVYSSKGKIILGIEHT